MKKINNPKVSKLKIAISSTGNNLESDVDSRFGRCPYFLIINIENNKIKNFKAIENVAKDQMGGAGVKAGEIVANQKVNAVITTNLGPRPFSVFKQFKIDAFKGEGKIKQVIQKFLKGNLKKLTDSTGN